MSTKQSFETKRIDHLGIVAGICHEIGLIATINRAVGPSGRPHLQSLRDLTDSELCEMMIFSKSTLEILLETF